MSRDLPFQHFRRQRRRVVFVLRIHLPLLAAFVVAQALAATQDLAGTWQGTLAVDPKTTMTIQFTFTKRADGSYSAVLNSPDNPAIKNVAASQVSWSQDTLRVQVASLGGGYAGTFKGGAVEGHWTQQGSALPLLLRPYHKPQISKQDRDRLVGAWHGALRIPGGSFTVITRFTLDAQGELLGTLAMQQQSPVSISDIEFADAALAFRIPQLRATYTARYGNGVLTGFWKQSAPGAPAEGLPLTLQRGEPVGR